METGFGSQNTMDTQAITQSLLRLLRSAGYGGGIESALQQLLSSGGPIGGKRGGTGANGEMPGFGGGTIGVWSDVPGLGINSTGNTGSG